MRVIRLIMVLAACVLLGCGGGESDFSAEHAAQLSITANLQATLALPEPSTAQAFFPAGTFDQDVIALLGDQLLRTDASWRYFPTVDQNAITDGNAAQMEADHQGDIYAALVINTPADVLFNQDIVVRFDPFENAIFVPGESYVVYRFDFQDEYAEIPPRWTRWGNDASAVVETFGSYAQATLPTTGFRGYIGSIAIFKGHTDTALAATEQQTRIYGKVVDAAGNGVRADVGLYQTVGGTQYPAGLDAPNGRAPIGIPHPVLKDQTIFELNTVESDIDGLFEMIIPDRLIGQLVHLEFGHEFAAFSTQEEFNLLDPSADPDNPAARILLSDTANMVIWYGENNVISLPVAGTT